MWSYYVSELISQKLRDRGIADADETIKWSLTKQFCRRKAEFLESLDSQAQLLYYSLPQSHELQPNMPFVAFPLKPHEIEDCFNRGLEGPRELGQKKLRQLVNYPKHISIGVVGAGGSLNMEHAKDAVFADSPVPKDSVIYTTDMENLYLWVLA